MLATFFAQSLFLPYTPHFFTPENRDFAVKQPEAHSVTSHAKTDAGNREDGVGEVYNVTPL